MGNQSSWKSGLRQMGAATTIPMILIAGPFLGFWIGSWLDVKFTTDPWAKVIVSLLGFAASLKQVIGIIRRLIKEED